MGNAELEFDRRLKKIVRRHDQMRNGVSHVMTRDGLIIARPRRRAPRFPLKGVLMLLAAGILFKALMYYNLGGVTYGERVGQLENGTVVEQAGAWVMQADPATLWVAQQMRTFLH